VLTLRKTSSPAVRGDEVIASCVRSESAQIGAAQIEELRAKATRYRQLAESLFDPGMVAVVLTCARELEAEAASLEAATTAVPR
jgi:hypothetical protein